MLVLCNAHFACLFHANVVITVYINLNVVIFSILNFHSNNLSLDGGLFQFFQVKKFNNRGIALAVTKANVGNVRIHFVVESRSLCNAASLKSLSRFSSGTREKKRELFVAVSLSIAMALSSWCSG